MTTRKQIEQVHSEVEKRSEDFVSIPGREMPGSLIGSSPILDRESARRGVLRITLFTLISNIFLAAIKAVAGLLSGSAALISDALNSASDVLFGIVVLVGVKLAGKEADDDHPYGHERFESLATLFLGAVVSIAGLGIGWDGLQKVWQGAQGSLEAPHPAALWVAALVIAFKGFMFLFTKARSKKYRSDVLAAAAADHGADVLGTAGVFIGIAAAQFGLPIMDPIASLVIAAFIVKTGIEIIRTAIGQVTDRSAGPEIDEKIREAILQNEHVTSVDKVISRVFGDRIFADVEISLPGDYSLCKAHDIAEEIHDLVEDQIDDVKHCMVHVNPSNCGHCEDGAGCEFCDKKASGRYPCDEEAKPSSEMDPLELA
jgi:cation diffusion facilitator family transporter